MKRITCFMLCLFNLSDKLASESFTIRCRHWPSSPALRVISSYSFICYQYRKRDSSIHSICMRIFLENVIIIDSGSCLWRRSITDTNQFAEYWICKYSFCGFPTAPLIYIFISLTRLVIIDASRSLFILFLKTYLTA